MDACSRVTVGTVRMNDSFIREERFASPLGNRP
jgi:hypothetical protein